VAKGSGLDGGSEIENARVVLRQAIPPFMMGHHIQ